MQATKEELERRRQFEDAIKRPYFHVKPLDRNQLVAWNSYIDYVLANGDAGTIVRLFERCLVACASYPGSHCLQLPSKTHFDSTGGMSCQ